MNPNSETKEPEDSVDVVQIDSSSSVDEFIKQLEAKEKDLHITADYHIEISNPEFDAGDVPRMVEEELADTNTTPPRPEPSPVGPKTRIYELEKEIEALQVRITSLCSERNDIQAKSDRRLKDFENFRYRMDRERRGAFINQIGNLATQMLPVLDNLDRAVDSVKDLPQKKRDEFKQFFDGITLVNQQINEVFAEMGVQPIATIGEAFDPNFHEAVATEETDELAPNTISGEMLRGYRIGNKVIRHSLVRVTSNPPAPQKVSKKPVLADLSAGPDDEREALQTDDISPEDK